MSVTRKLIAPNKSNKNSILKMDSNKTFVVNQTKKWQMLFGPNSTFTNSSQVVKLSARFDDDTFNNIKIIGYLYDSKNNTVANSATCTFKIFKINNPTWTETLITTLNGTQLFNNYFYVNPVLSTLTPLDFFGGDSIMIEATITRLNETYRERIYVNHLGIFDNVFRLRQDVEFLDISKVDE